MYLPRDASASLSTPTTSSVLAPSSLASSTVPTLEAFAFPTIITSASAVLASPTSVPSTPSASLTTSDGATSASNPDQLIEAQSTTVSAALDEEPFDTTIGGVQTTGQPELEATDYVASASITYVEFASNARRQGRIRGVALWAMVGLFIGTML